MDNKGWEIISVLVWDWIAIPVLVNCVLRILSWKITCYFTKVQMGEVAFKRMTPIRLLSGCFLLHLAFASVSCEKWFCIIWKSFATFFQPEENQTHFDLKPNSNRASGHALECIFPLTAQLVFIRVISVNYLFAFSATDQSWITFCTVVLLLKVSFKLY